MDAFGQATTSRRKARSIWYVVCAVVCRSLWKHYLISFGQEHNPHVIMLMGVPSACAIFHRFSFGQEHDLHVIKFIGVPSAGAIFYRRHTVDPDNGLVTLDVQAAADAIFHAGRPPAIQRYT